MMGYFKPDLLWPFRWIASELMWHPKLSRIPLPAWVVPRLLGFSMGKKGHRVTGDHPTGHEGGEG